MRRILLRIGFLGALGACTVPDSPLSDPTGDGGLDGSAGDAAVSLDAKGDGAVDDVLIDGAPSLDAADVAVDVGVDAARDLGIDKTKFFGASRCPTSAVLLCEDFESGTLDTKTWTVGGTAPVIDGVQHARGGKALHLKRVGTGNSTIKETKTFPAPKNKYFGRMFVYFHLLPSSPDVLSAHWTIVAASGTGVMGEIRLSGMLNSGVNHFGVGTDSGADLTGTGDWNTSDSDPGGKPLAVPQDDWTCLEWMHDGEANETRFWWDGVEHPSMHTTSSVHGGNTHPFVLPQFTQLVLGWVEYQTSTQTYESWIDEIVIDKERVGCVL